MRSEFLMRSTPVQDQGQQLLRQRGYTATGGSTYRGPTVTVDHAEADLRLIEEILQAVDPTTQRY